jgi:hypothetical protein
MQGGEPFLITKGDEMPSAPTGRQVSEKTGPQLSRVSEISQTPASRYSRSDRRRNLLLQFWYYFRKSLVGPSFDNNLGAIVVPTSPWSCRDSKYDVVCQCFPFPFLSGDISFWEVFNLVHSTNFKFQPYSDHYASSARILSAIQDPSSPAPRFVRIPDGDHYRLQYRIRSRKAKHIVVLGAAKVILGVRNLSKALSAKASIETSTGRTGIIEVCELDLERFASVKAFAARAESLDRLDTAIMNAGVASLQWNLSPDGRERQLQVNVLSTTR